MADIVLTGSTGALFNRFDVLASEYNRVVSGYGAALTTSTVAIWDQYPLVNQEGLAIADLPAARDAYRQVHGSYENTLQGEMVNTFVQQANRSVPLVPYNLATALGLVRKQMVTNSASINRPTLSSAVTPFASNYGDGVILTSTTNQYGDPLDMLMQESIISTVNLSANNGGVQYQEAMQFTGEPIQSAQSYTWPGGSGATGTLRFTDAAITGQLTDGSFETWVGSTPTYWTVGVGSATVNKNSANVVRGTYSFAITSDGSTLTQVYQELASPKINTVYAFNVWAKMASLDASGIMRFRLTDSSGVTLTNDAGTALSYTRNTNGQIGTSFTQVGTFFQTPKQLPTDGIVRFEFAYTVAPANGKIMYLDLLGFVAGTQLYPGGIFASAFSKDTPNSIGDYYTLAQTNSFDVHSNVRELDRFFNMRNLGVYLPSSNSPTIPDNIT